MTAQFVRCSLLTIYLVQVVFTNFQISIDSYTIYFNLFYTLGGIFSIWTQYIVDEFRNTEHMSFMNTNSQYYISVTNFKQES